jgi:hypothetical protein
MSIHTAQPSAGSNNQRRSFRREDERRYLQYIVARLGAFSNLTWDLGDDLGSIHDEKWAHEIGMLAGELGSL